MTSDSFNDFYPFYPFYRGRSDSLTESIPKTNKNIVLDIDETLVHTFDDDHHQQLYDLNLIEDPNLLDLRARLYVLPLVDLSRTGDSYMNLYWGIMRPGLRDFLKFANKYFDKVCVWSAGHREYVERVCSNIFRGMEKPVLIFSSENCEKLGTHNIKPLIKMFNHPNAAGMTLENTFVLDDRASTFSQNPLNGIQIPAYMPADTVDGMRFEEPSLGKLSSWFLNSEVVSSPDIRSLDKSRIFFANGAKIASPRNARF